MPVGLDLFYRQPADIHSGRHNDWRRRNTTIPFRRLFRKKVEPSQYTTSTILNVTPLSNIFGFDIKLENPKISV
jgi:hypothetical protein